jgi:hypothetical protein
VNDRIPPNRDLIGLARTLERLAWRDTAVREHIGDELALLDGHASRGGGGGRVTGGGAIPRPVETAAFAREQLTNMLQNLADDRDAIGQLVRSFQHDLEQAARLRGGTDTRALADDVRLCDGTVLTGSDVRWERYSRDPDNGWFDPDCRDLTDGDDVLCARCRPRERRWRLRRGLPLRAANTPEPTRQELPS